jgi:ketosteroid isomerase-like protein
VAPAIRYSIAGRRPPVLRDTGGVSDENLEVVRQLFEAFNSEDVDRVLELTHADFEVDIPPSISAEPDVYRGHDGMRRYLASFQDAMEEIRFQPERHWDAGEDVVVTTKITAKGRRTAIAVEQHTTAVWTIRHGKALRARVFATPGEALAAAGVTE